MMGKDRKGEGKKGARRMGMGQRRVRKEETGVAMLGWDTCNMEKCIKVAMLLQVMRHTQATKAMGISHTQARVKSLLNRGKCMTSRL